MDNSTASLERRAQVLTRSNIVRTDDIEWEENGEVQIVLSFEGEGEIIMTIRQAILDTFQQCYEEEDRYRIWFSHEEFSEDDEMKLRLEMYGEESTVKKFKIPVGLAVNRIFYQQKIYKLCERTGRLRPEPGAYEVF